MIDSVLGHAGNKAWTAAVLAAVAAPLLHGSPASATELRDARPVFTVNSDDDRGDDDCDARHCNLREAIRAANAADGARIHFALPAHPYRIALTRPLPPLRGNITLDGATQPGSGCPLPIVHIDGAVIEAETAVNGVEVLGNGNHVRGLAVTGFSGHGILVRGSENLLQCLFVGVDPSGLRAAGNGGHGIAVGGGHSNRIGGPARADGTLLSANGGRGLYIEDAINTERAYNGIGLDAFGQPSLPNTEAALPPVNPPPDPPNGRDPRALAAIVSSAELRIARIDEQHRRALEDAGLYEKYLRLIDARDDAPPPAGLSELVAALTRQPDLYAAFTAEAASVLDSARRAAAAQLHETVHAVRQSLPAFGRTEPEQAPDRRDPLGEALSALSPGDYVLSGPPSELTVVEASTSPDTINTLWWHSLTVAGPTDFNAPHPYQNELPKITTCTGTTTACQWPIAYDLLPASMMILWESLTFTQQEIEDIVQENGYLLELYVNNQWIVRIEPPELEHQNDYLNGYYAASVPAAPCPANRQCLATSVTVRNRLANVPQPWTFELRIKKVEALDFPAIIGFDNFANPIYATHETQQIAQASRTVLPNPDTGGQRWFDAALYETFQHPRCTDCHGFGTFENLAAHHGYGHNVQFFVQDTNLHLEPSDFVPGAHVMACYNCHSLSGMGFSETRWRAPFHDLDVDWQQMSSPQICSKVKTNLPTLGMLVEHFHGDARLFWAIEMAEVLGVKLDTAPPYDFNEFLRRVDMWIKYGRPCP